MAQRHAIGRGGDRVIEHGAEGRRRRLEPVGAVQREISSHLAVSRSIVVHQDREGGLILGGYHHCFRWPLRRGRSRLFDGDNLSTETAQNVVKRALRAWPGSSYRTPG